MDKRGSSISKAMTLIFLGLFFIVLITVFITGEGSIVGGMKGLIPSISDWVGRDTDPTNDVRTREAQDRADEVANKVMIAYRQLAEDPYKDGCFYFLRSEDIEDLNDYEVEFKNNGKNLDIYLWSSRKGLEEQQLRGGRPISQATIENANPCLVYGKSETENFYNYYFDKKGQHAISKPSGHYDTSFTDYYITGSDLVITGDNDASREVMKYTRLDWDAEGRDQSDTRFRTFVLYKHEDNICVFPAKPACLFCTGCDVRKDAQLLDAYMLDSDCFNPKKNPSIYNMHTDGAYAVWKDTEGKCVEYNTP